MTGRPSVDDLADEFVDRYVDLDPLAATHMGLPGFDDRMTDVSPAGDAARTSLQREVLARLPAVEEVDESHQASALVLEERLEAALALADSGHTLGDLNVIASPVQAFRDAFDLMPTGTVEQRDVVARRMAAVPAAVDGYIEALRARVAAGNPPARRQVEGCIVQCDANVGPAGFFRTFADGLAAPDDTPGPLAGDLAQAADAAAGAYARLAAHLREEVLPAATEVDAVGREAYAVHLRHYAGESVDLDDAYAWGVDEVRRLRAEGQAVARSLGCDGITEAIALLETDPGRRIEGSEAFRDWMQGVSDDAVSALAGRWFEIPDDIRRLDCRIAPTRTGAVYYTGPSDDLTRPGTMWWSVPEGVTSFSTWQQRTVVYHEGVPGHHLQIASSVLQREHLNRFRRLMCWVPGHGEGWALYAEGLMAELGYLDDPGDRLGLVASQLLRAVRVVIDIGVHCGMTAPDEAGGGVWSVPQAWEYMVAMVPETDPDRMLAFELDRYLGWPGQAPTYKLGERAWLDLRERARSQPGFDPVDWHRRMLDLGSMGLAPLRHLAGAPAQPVTTADR
jgi:uncharacterized protein (DUF885 family)